MDKYKEKIKEYAKRQENGAVLPCPRCGKMTMNVDMALNCVSRIAPIYICDFCGSEEGFADANLDDDIPIENWAMFRKKN